MKIKNIAFIGNFVAPESTENHLKWTLEDLGYKVIGLQENIDTTDHILDVAKACDLLIYVHTHGWFTPGTFDLTELFNRLKSLKIPTASFHLDYWFGLTRQDDVGKHPFWHTKYVFTADGGSNNWYREQGINHFWLKPAVVKRDCYMAEKHSDYDLIFVGSNLYHNEWDYRPQLINWLKMNYGGRFRRFGNPDFTDDSVFPVRGRPLNQLYADAKVVVGDSLCLNFTHEDYWSDRVYETIGRGGFLIHPYIKGLEKEFVDGETIVFYKFGDFDELKTKINYYIENDEAREKIRKQGFEFVRNNATYNDRMDEMIGKITAMENKEKKNA